MGTLQPLYYVTCVFACLLLTCDGCRQEFASPHVPSLKMRATGPCVLIVWCYVTRDLSLSHTDVPPPLSSTPSATVEHTRLHLCTLRITGRDSNVLLTDGSRWPMTHTVHVCVMMITRNNGFGSPYVAATLLCDVFVRVSPV